MESNLIQFSTLKKRRQGRPKKESAKINDDAFLEKNKEMMEKIKTHCVSFTQCVEKIGLDNGQDIGIQITFAFEQP